MFIIAILFSIFMIFLILALTINSVTIGKQSDQIKALTAKNAKLESKLAAAEKKIYTAAFRQVLREEKDA